jgi:FHA domain
MLADNDEFGSAVELRLTVKEQSCDADVRGTVIAGDTVAKPEKPKPPATPLYRPTVRAPMAVVKLFHDGVTTFTSYPVFADRFRIGRIAGDLIVLHDSWMSGRHAEIQRRHIGNRFHWYLVDQKSTNGSFVRSDSTVLKNNDELFLGQERYRFSTQNGRPGLIHATKGTGQQWWFRGRKEIIGSKPPCGLPSFASDPYLDPEHAILIQRPDGAWEIQDNHSQNGLWYRIMEIELSSNSAFQLGEQRFGFWFNDDH